MMRMRSSQLELFRDAALRALAARWLPTLKQHFQAQLGARTDAWIVDDTVLGIRRGLEHGLTTDADLYRFVIVRIALGDGFDVNPSIPWARALLADEEMPERLLTTTLVARSVQHLARQPAKGPAPAEAPRWPPPPAAHATPAASGPALSHADERAFPPSAVRIAGTPR